jgi:hypothetical protein
MANVALEAFAGFCQHSFVSNEKTWVALTLNKSGKNEGKYDFTGDDFVLPATVFTGAVDGDDYWLVAVLESGACNKGGCFEFKSWKNGADGAKGSFDKTASDALAVKWQSDGCLALIHCNDIPVLKTAAKVLHELKIVVKPGSGEITVRTNIVADQCHDIEVALAEFWCYLLANEGNTPDEGTKEYERAVTIAQAGIMALPAMANEDLPCKVLYDVMGKKKGVKLECFPFTGELPSYDAVSVAFPKKEERKKSNGNGYGGGATVTTTVTGYLSPSDRTKYLCDSLRAMGFDVIGDSVDGIAACIAKNSPVKGENPCTQAMKLAYQMTTDNWIL